MQYSYRCTLTCPDTITISQVELASYRLLVAIEGAGYHLTLNIAEVGYLWHRLFLIVSSHLISYKRVGRLPTSSYVFMICLLMFK